MKRRNPKSKRSVVDLRRINDALTGRDITTAIQAAVLLAQETPERWDKMIADLKAVKSAEARARLKHNRAKR